MNIAIITKSATTKSGAKVPFELAEHLAKHCRVTVLAKKENAQKDLVAKLKKQKITLILYKNIFDLYLNLQKGKFDLISFHSTLRALLISKLTFLPVIRTYYGTQFDAYLERFLPNEKINFMHKLINSMINLLLWCDQKLILLLSNQVIAISKAAQKELKKLYAVNSTVIYLGSNIKPTTSYQQPATNNQLPTTILSVSRFTPYKGFHTLIDAVNDLRAKGLNLKLVLVGSSPKKNYLKYLKRKMSGNDQIITNIDDGGLAKLYASCDVYATFGKPQIALNYQAAGELILDGKTGYVANSQQELEKCLTKFLKNKEKRKKMGNASRNYAQKNFNWSKIALEYFKIFSPKLK